MSGTFTCRIWKWRGREFRSWWELRSERRCPAGNRWKRWGSIWSCSRGATMWWVCVTMWEKEEREWGIEAGRFSVDCEPREEEEADHWDLAEGGSGVVCRRACWVVRMNNWKRIIMGSCFARRLSRCLLVERFVERAEFRTLISTRWAIWWSKQRMVGKELCFEA